MSPTLGKPATDFGKLCFHEEDPFLAKASGKKTYSVFGKTCFVFWQYMLRFWGTHAPFLGRTGSLLGQSGSVWVKNRLGLGEIGSLLGLAWGSSLIVFEHKARFGLDF